MDPKVRAAFDAAPAPARDGMLALRAQIFRVAATLPHVGRIDETLRWAQPAYLTLETKSGSTIRIGTPKSGGFALYCNCQTTLIADFRDLAGDTCRYDGNRAVLFETVAQIATVPIDVLIRRALTWHRRKLGRPP